MQNKKIAIFFDCENVSASYVPSIFDELANIGEVIIRKTFKDWRSKNDKAWNQKLHEEFAIETVQIFHSRNKKNTADLRIQRDVMEVMNQKNVDIITLVSSDSDFRDLAMFIRESGFESIGFGESKTPLSLKNAYLTFIELPIKKEYEKSNNKEVIILLKEAIQKTIKEDDYSLVSQMGNYLKNKNPSYNPKNFGATTWGDIIKKIPSHFEWSHLDKEKSQMIVKLKNP